MFLFRLLQNPREEGRKGRGEGGREGRLEINEEIYLFLSPSIVYTVLGVSLLKH